MGNKEEPQLHQSAEMGRVAAAKREIAASAALQ
jgi:hypothetical protein